MRSVAGLEPDDRWFGQQAVYRVSLGSCLYFATLAAALAGVRFRSERAALLLGRPYRLLLSPAAAGAAANGGPGPSAAGDALTLPPAAAHNQAPGPGAYACDAYAIAAPSAACAVEDAPAAAAAALGRLRVRISPDGSLRLPAAALRGGWPPDALLALDFVALEEES